MTLVSSEVRVAGTGEIFVAPVGTAAPVDVATALNAAFVGLGYSTDNGVAMKRTVNREQINAWQSLTPLRYVYTGLELTVQSEFIQSNEKVLKLYLASGDFAANGAEYKADIPTVPTQDKRALVVEWLDGLLKNRLYIPEVEVTDTGDMTLNKTVAQGYNMTFGALAPSSGGTVLATWFTNDTNFAP